MIYKTHVADHSRGVRFGDVLFLGYDFCILFVYLIGFMVYSYLFVSLTGFQTCY